MMNKKYFVRHPFLLCCFNFFTFAAAFSGSRERLKAEGSKCT